MKETLILKAKEARMIAYHQHEFFEDVTSKITGKTRWSICYEKIVKRIPDGKLFKYLGCVENIENLFDIEFSCGDGKI